MTTTPPIQNADFTVEELRLLLRALTIPECWNPRLREEAARLVETTMESQQLSLLAEAGA